MNIEWIYQNVSLNIFNTWIEYIKQSKVYQTICLKWFIEDDCSYRYNY